MSPDQWSRVKDLFAGALRLSPAERPSFLAAGTDPPFILDEVRSLLATYEDSPDFLEGAAPALPPGSPEEVFAPPLAGRQIGPWELIREIGRGGMGVVWEARRADEQYEQRAAIKLLHTSLFSDEDIRRFRDERQILASLNHPGIAGLLDGGTLEDGSPWLAMEYVEGPALDDWCCRQKLNLRERLGLFLQVCAAVEYAHRHMVIHRDLKPANILVTPEGTPKLLDFGIAKLITTGPGPARATTRLLTPEFASPEQLRGEMVTTASDVFSLGVLLYVLLAFRHPFAAADDNTLEMLRAICEEEPPLPSTVAPDGRRELRGELDAIILQALRKNPDHRYPSVRGLADDLRAWLEGRPVSAVPQPWWRRSVKLVRRYRIQSAAVALAVLSLLAGTGVSLWQAHVAQLQRERAERRFAEVRKFSRSLLFELHDSIRGLPGATSARNLLLTRATEFLDDLARDPSADAALKLELAQGYVKLGRVQGDAFSENLGRHDASIASFRKAVRLAEDALAAPPTALQAALVLFDVYDDLARAYVEQHDLSNADVWDGKQRDLAAAMEARYPGDNRMRAAIAADYSSRAFYRTQRNDLTSAKELYRKALNIFQDLVAAGFDTDEIKTERAFAFKRLGAILIMENSLDEAANCYDNALRIEDARLAANPGNIPLHIWRSFTVSDLALISMRKNDLPRAAGMYRDVLSTRQAALEADPANLRYVRLAASASMSLGKVYSSMKLHKDAITLGREAVRLRDRAATISNSYEEQRESARARVNLATLILAAAGDRSFHPGPGERVANAVSAIDEAGRFVRNPGTNQLVSPADLELKADYQAVRVRLARLK